LNYARAFPIGKSNAQSDLASAPYRL